ncbi:ATP-binding cassette domain-containing protein [Paenibacillus pinihumi]|uniref:ATP-binding cassette domain-containing protein n=1 Tax=Paenibacillus pinihumi TaxID=669462 RepID=UPI00041181F6|nr:ABC transporter ATP-binding protein [Paenibacillus pinihumi]
MSYETAFHQVNMTYGNFQALKDISFRLEEEKIYGLLGRNGAGKSTLLSLLAAYRKPSTGTVTIGGQEVFENSQLMSQVALSYNTDYSEESDKVKDMLDAAACYRPNFDSSYAEHLVKQFKLPRDKQVKKLSNGMKSALNVTIGLASRCPVTIFDEAYVGMDAPTREIFYRELLEDHARHPRTIILSTHLVSEMDYLFEEIIIIKRGRLLMQERSDQFLELGVSVTGATQVVEDFVRGMKRLSTRQLGGTTSVRIYGELSEMQHKEARKLGLELGNVSMQDLFIHLTEEEDTDDVQK